MPLEQRPGLISLLAGKPHTSTFPFTSLNFTFRDPADPQSELPVSLSQSELDEGLQYSPTVGISGLVEWAYGLQELAHGRKRGEGWKLSIGNGSQDLLYKVSDGSACNILGSYYYSIGGNCASKPQGLCSVRNSRLRVSVSDAMGFTAY